MGRPDVAARFATVVARGIARADAEQAAHLTRLRNSGPPRAETPGKPPHLSDRTAAQRRRGGRQTAARRRR